MLTPQDFDKVSKQASQIYGNLELEIIQEIATRIASAGYANTVVTNDILIAQEMGILYQDIIDLVAKYNNQTYEEIQNIFKEAGAKTLKFDDKIYKQAGLKPLPMKQSSGMLQLLTASAIKTNNNLNNLVMTTASTVQTDFYNGVNKAYMEVSTGIKSYSTAILDTIEELSTKGMLVTYPSGYKTSIENATRMNIITGVNQTCGKLQELRADEMNWDLMELTAHGGARPEHAEWQGKIVSRSGQKGYLSLDDIGYGDPTGFKGVNCRHDWYPYLKGSIRTYSQEMLKEYKNETVEYNGKNIASYEASQMQRKIERQIRNDKKELAGLEGILRSNTTDNKLIEDTKTDFAKKTLAYNTHKNQLEEFTRQTKLIKDNSRISTGTIFNKTVTTELSNITKLANKYNNSDIIGINVGSTTITEIGEHIISRSYARDLKVENIIDTLKNPVKYGKIRTDMSQQIRGKTCTVVINTETGKLVTIYGKKTQKE